MKNKILSLGIALLALVAGVSCDKNDGVDGAGLKVEFTETSVQFGAGEEKDLVFAVSGASGACTFDEERTTIPAEGWTVQLVNFSVSNGTGNGTLRAKAPETITSGKIFIYVKSETGELASASIQVSSLDKPSEEVILTVEKTLTMKAAETKKVAFTVREQIKRELDAVVQIMPDDGKWSARIAEFKVVEGGYDGVVEITAPAESSKASITIRIDDKNDEKTSYASTTIEASCTAPEVGVVLKLEQTSCTIAPSANAEIGFTVTGKDAVDLQAEIVPTSDDWKCSIKEFAAASAGGYTGVIAITAPATEGSAKASLTIKDKDGKEVAVELITLSATTINVTFELKSYSFSALQKRDIGIDVTCNGKVTLKSITTDLWRVQANSSTPKTDGTGYTGYVTLMAPSIPDEAELIIRVIDSAENVSDFAVKVSCEGGLPAPAIKSGANCIVVNKTGDVSFDAVKGNGEAVAGSKVALIWADNTNMLDENTLAYANGKISFKTGASFRSGNALVALLDSAGTIKWSWHLWFVQGLNLDAASGTFMNMNLGATSSEKVAESLGMLYQWGRKEAFPGPKDFSTDAEEAEEAFSADNMRAFTLADGYKWGVVDAVMASHDAEAQHPTELIYLGSQLAGSQSTDGWSAEADPCPKGWRVPNHKELAEHWDVVNGHAFIPNTYKAYGNGSTPVDYPDEWWPAAGNRMTHNGIRGWNGALRLTNYSGYYWSSTASFSKSEYDSEADIQDIGYNSGSILSWSAYNSINVSLSATNAKTTASSVRCIKE